ncbi:hypothetical protein CEP86_32370 [Pseudomonas protegens]|nr:hypothetical protein CEP86_32370 [Pseudomonas protegens]
MEVSRPSSPASWLLHRTHSARIPRRSRLAGEGDLKGPFASKLAPTQNTRHTHPRRSRLAGEGDLKGPFASKLAPTQNTRHTHPP